VTTSFSFGASGRTVSAVRSLAILMLVGLCACNGPPPPPDRPAPVPGGGRVLLSERALPGATVSFLSLDGRVSCTATTDDAGEFTLSTYGSGDGAPPGMYKVVVSIDEFSVSPDGKITHKRGAKAVPQIPGKYSRQADTPLQVEVTADGPNRFQLSLK
jgi:hypothetical protein